MNPTRPIFYPNVNKIPANPNVSDAKKQNETGIEKGAFDKSLNEAMEQTEIKQPTQHLNSMPQGLKFSAHATQRLKDRQIQFDPETLARMNDAINKADAKGVQDTLVLTDKAALIVSVPNRTVITAMDRNQLTGNVFTNIDGAVII